MILSTQVIDTIRVSLAPDYQADVHELPPILTDPALADLPLTVHAEPPAEGWYCESHA